MTADGTPTPAFPRGGLLERFVPGRGDLRDLLAPNDFFNNVFVDDFRGDTLNAFYPAAATSGASAAVTFTEHNIHGWIDLVSGTDINGRAGQGLGLQYSGDRGVLLEFLVQTPADIANFKMEVGVSDIDSAAGVVDTKQTPTVNVTDATRPAFWGRR